mgnify:CR=1 FL=1
MKLDPYHENRSGQDNTSAISLRVNDYAVPVTEDELHDVGSLKHFMHVGYTHGIWYEAFGSKVSSHFVSAKEPEDLKRYWGTSLYGYVMVLPLTKWLEWAENKETSKSTPIK